MKPTLKILGLVSVLGVTAVAIVNLTNRTMSFGDQGQLSISTKRNLFAEVDTGAHIAGNAVYVVDQSGNGHDAFCGDSAKVGIKFIKDSTTQYIAPLEYVYDYTDEFSHYSVVYQGIVPSGATWDKVQVLRLNKAFKSGQDVASNIWDKTPEIDIYSGSEYRNTFGVNGLAGNSVLSTSGFWTTNASKRLYYMCTAYNIFKPSSWNENVCKADGSTDTGAVSTQWAQAGTYFGKLGTDVKGALSNAEADKNIEPMTDEFKACNLAGLAARYDVIRSRYGTSLSLTNWADR